MSKKRTKDQKKNPRHPFLVKWEEKNTKKQDAPRRDVKGQTKKPVKSKPRSPKHGKKAYSSGKEGQLASVKRDIIKSLSLASLIVGIEVVLYLIW